MNDISAMFVGDSAKRINMVSRPEHFLEQIIKLIGKC